MYILIKISSLKETYLKNRLSNNRNSNLLVFLLMEGKQYALSNSIIQLKQTNIFPSEKYLIYNDTVF